jgi:hypothetical protein
MTPALRRSLIAVFTAILAAIGVWLSGGDDPAPVVDADPPAHDDDDSAVLDDDDSSADDDDSGGEG